MRAPDWVRGALGAWARQWWRIHTTDASIAGTLGKIRTEAEGAAHSRAGQHFDEVYTGDALAVRLALDGAPWAVWQILGATYLPRGEYTAGERARALGISRAEYFARLDAAHWYLVGRIERENPGSTAEPSRRLGG